MKIALSLVWVAAVATSAGSDVTPARLRWDHFPGPVVQPPVATGSALIVAPLQGSDWTGRVHFAYAKALRVDNHELVVEGIHGEVYVPGAFVAPHPAATKPLKVGAIVRFQPQPTLVFAAELGRVASVGRGDDGGTVYHVTSNGAGEVEDDEVSPRLIDAVDNTLRFGAPVRFDIDGEPAMGFYVGPGHDAGHAWVLSVDRAREKTGVKPLVVQPFKKGAKVLVAIGTTSVAKGGVNLEPRNLLEPATVVEVIDKGVAYKVKRPDGEIVEGNLDEVFAP